MVSKLTTNQALLIEQKMTDGSDASILPVYLLVISHLLLLRVGNCYQPLLTIINHDLSLFIRQYQPYHPDPIENPH